MEFGNILVYLSILLAVAGIFFSLLRLRTGKDDFTAYARFMTLLLFVTVTATVLYLYMLFITSDLSIEYVWTYTDTSYPLYYKLSGVLAGMAGSLLFWIWMVIIPWFYEEMKAVKHPKNASQMDWTRIFIFLVMAILLFILAVHNLFKPTPADYLNYRPDGNGLNPILQTFLMTIHPPIVFVSYGLLALPFAAGLAHFITGDEKWSDICINWSRVGWLFLTLGIGIGALWAYIVLGWGGYWGWDPVETSSLLPWILLTGFLHVQLMYRRKKEYPMLAPLLGAFTFILVIFATFATRAGGLWVSVHTFGQADVSIDAWTRFTDILANNQAVSYYFAAMLALTALTIMLALYRKRKTTMDGEEKTYSLSELINDEILMLATSFLFILLTAVTMLILVRGVNGLAPENFNGPVGILVIAIIFTMVFCVSWRILGRKRVSQIALATVIASAVGIMLFPDNMMAAGAFPILMVSMVVVAFAIIKLSNMKRPWQSLKVISAHLVHLAVIFLIIGYIGSSFLGDQQNIALDMNGGSQDAFGYTFELADIDDTSLESLFVEIDIYEGDSFVGKARPGVTAFEGQIRHEIEVVDTLSKDIYIIYNFDSARFQQGQIDLEVKILPMMKFLWGGMWLMTIGIIIRLVTAKFQPGKKGKKIDEDEEPVSREEKDIESDGTADHEEPSVKDSRPKDEPAEKDDSYYEAMLETELEKTDGSDNKGEG